MNDGGKVCIGSGTSFEDTAISMAEDNNSVIIGKDNMFASQILVLGSDFHSVIDLTTNQRTNYANGIKTGEHVWIGMNSIITKNVEIGNNVVVAAGAIVCNNLPDHCACGGNPAKVIKNNITWDRRRL